MSRAIMVKTSRAEVTVIGSPSRVMSPAASSQRGVAAPGASTARRMRCTRRW